MREIKMELLSNGIIVEREGNRSIATSLYEGFIHYADFVGRKDDAEKFLDELVKAHRSVLIRQQEAKNGQKEKS